MVFANEIQQLLVTVSRHLYVSKSGVLRYQEKPVEVDTTNFHRSRKDHLLYYVLRDLFSGNFIFAVTTTKELLPLIDFLYFGWKKDKEEGHFWGLPLRLSLPKRISSPELIAGLQRLEVEPFHPSSGFTSGIRIIKSLEDNLYHFALRRSAIHSLDTVQRRKNHIYRYMLEGSSDSENRIDLWRSNLLPGPPREVPEYHRFRALFPTPEVDQPALPLLGSPAEGHAATVIPRQLDFLDSPIESSKFSPGKLLQAGKLLYAAYDARYRNEGLHAVYKALHCSPYCTEAYNLMAHESSYRDEKMALYRRAVQAGELSLGELFFRRNEGSFWSHPETRPYMRALHGLADTLWEMGDREETLKIYQEMLRLNHNDNQGIRYQLGFRLLDEERYDEMERLYQAFKEETCFMLYNLVLSRFCSKAVNAVTILRRALEANKHVPAYLLGEEQVPYRQPDHYSHGSKEEAAIYASETAAAWRKAAGALNWLQKNRPGFRETKPVKTAEPNIVSVLQDFLKEQAARLGKATFRKYELAIEMLQAYLNRYASEDLDSNELEMLERYHKENGIGDYIYPFCCLFGPEKIPHRADDFLTYFMPHKVGCGKDQLRTTGTTLKRLAGWLAGRGYISDNDAAEMADAAARAYREVPAADEFSQALHDFVENSPPVQGDEEMEDLFIVVKIEPGKLHLQAVGKEPVVIAVPPKISSLCRKEWMLRLLLIKTKQGWRIARAGRVYTL